MVYSQTNEPVSLRCRSGSLRRSFARVGIILLGVILAPAAYGQINSELARFEFPADPSTQADLERTEPYLLDSQKVFHFRNQTFGYRIPSTLKLPVTGKLGFQNRIQLEENGTRLQAYYMLNRLFPEKSIENQSPGFYVFERDEFGQYTLYFSTSKSLREIRKTRYRLTGFGKLAWPDPLDFEQGDPSTELSAEETLFKHGVVSGLMVQNRSQVPTFIGLGANGYNLVTVLETVKSFENLYSISRVGFNPNDLQRVSELTEKMLDFLSIIRASGPVLSQPPIEQIIGRGITHCGNDAGLVQSLLAPFHVHAQRIGLANEWWGHAENLIRVGEQCLTVSGYDNFVIPYCPGDRTVHEGYLTSVIRQYHRRRGLNDLVRFYSEDDLTRQDGNGYHWLANINRAGFRVLYEDQPMAQRALLYPLAPGDRVVFDPRGGYEKDNSIVSEEIRALPIGIATLIRPLSEVQSTMNIVSPFPIRKIMIDGESAAVSVESEGNTATPLDLKTANEALGKSEIYHLRFQSLPSSGTLYVLSSFNSFMLPFAANKPFQRYKPETQKPGRLWTGPQQSRSQQTEESVKAYWPHNLPPPEVVGLKGNELDRIKRTTLRFQ